MHRHQYKGRKLSREKAHRKSLMRNLASQVILHEKITTTLPKAKEVRPIIEKLITRSKLDSVANRREVAKFLSNDPNSVKKLFQDLGPLYKDRNGGYIRIVKTGNRKGDNAEIAEIQLLDVEKLNEKAVKEELDSKEAKKPKTLKTKTVEKKKSTQNEKRSK